MSQALFSVASGARYLEQRLDVLANNMSNINTVGYKQDKLIFRVPKEEREREAPQGVGSLYSPPPTPAGTTIDFSQSHLKHTNNPLDLALQGEGFFCIDRGNGTEYTRKGTFALDPDGVLITRDGDPVLGEQGTIKISGKDVRIDENGKVYVDGEAAGAVKVVTVRDQNSLRKVGDSVFAPAQGEAEEVKAENVTVHQGFLESSNVNGLKAMTEMIDVMRGYESYQKVIHFLDDVTRKAISDVGKL